ncbi:MAG: hypothetical protein ACTSUE_08750 [Promethearchaeota archaeon]
MVTKTPPQRHPYAIQAGMREVSLPSPRVPSFSPHFILVFYFFSCSALLFLLLLSFLKFSALSH